MDKNEFIATTSVKILSGMYANSESYPNLSVAIEAAEDLWNALVKKGIVTE